MPFVALDPRWRLTLPKEIREQLDFKPGGAVYLEVRDGYLYVAPIDDPYVLMSHEEFMAEAERLEREHPIENYPELMQEIAEWDAIPDDWLADHPHPDTQDVVEDVHAAREG
jgi:AbrB family looped-hinge helix DNA binding protein